MNNHLGIMCFNYLYTNVQVRKIPQISSFPKNNFKLTFQLIVNEFT